MQTENRILFLVPSRLGDALMLTPALHTLKKLKPKSQIDILALGSLGGSVFKNNPNCHKIYHLSELSDTSIFLQDYSLAISCFRSKAVDLIKTFNISFAIIGGANETDHYALQAENFIKSLFDRHDTIAQTTGYQIFPTQFDFSFAKSTLTETDVKYIGIHLGCHGISKKKSWLSWGYKQPKHRKIWPIENFIHLARIIRQKDPHVRFVLTGSERELPLANIFLKQLPDTINLMGKTTVLQLGAIMEKLAAFICPDTGTMHLACTTSTPIIALFGPTNPVRTGPYLATPSRYVIKADDLSTLKPVDVAEIVTSALGTNGIAS